MSNIRIGRVSRIDYENGMIAVAYMDRNESVTKLMPYLQMGGEYHMPRVEQRILVLHCLTIPKSASPSARSGMMPARLRSMERMYFTRS